MPAELSWLAAAVALLFVHVLAEGVVGRRQYGAGFLLGPRDELPPRGALLGRARRANRNMIDALAIFAPLVPITVAAGRTNHMTARRRAIFFLARPAYGRSYWFGLPVIRPLIWFTGVAGTVIVFLQILPFSGAH